MHTHRTLVNAVRILGHEAETKRKNKVAKSNFNRCKLVPATLEKFEFKLYSRFELWLF